MSTVEFPVSQTVIHDTGSYASVVQLNDGPATLTLADLANGTSA